eukprot:1588927-Rhodomonas_salina.3
MASDYYLARQDGRTKGVREGGRGLTEAQGDLGGKCAPSHLALPLLPPFLWLSSLQLSAAAPRAVLL